ncbi:hypothetical protein GOBAR_AA00995 [Gossypium barbadense]|uniref:Transposase Tnp1/En/Spm-like domain-containing protein n=1 Tax=Gossypium barbadense TaxID=3634 RepID=A0A2P5YVJ4_GOSBA|nr:hypothetical protein GOBAR_AA00995 [Gossypium barbadense]
MRRRRLRDLSIVQNAPNSKEVNSEQQTVVGSLNVPKTLDEASNLKVMLTETGGSRRGRGRTVLKDLYDLNPVERVKVRRNSHGQPVGSEAQLLAGYLGIIARNANMLPINYESWHYTSDSNKNQALDNIKERFALEVSDDYIKKELGKKWRDHKSSLKKAYFKKDISLKENLQDVPPGMLRYQWEDAVRFWNSKKGEETHSNTMSEPCSRNNKCSIQEKRRLQMEELDEWLTQKPSTHHKPKPSQDELNTSPNQLKVGDKVLLDTEDLRIATSEPNEAIPLTVLNIFPYGTVEVTHSRFDTFKVNSTRLKPYVDKTNNRNEEFKLLEPP